MDQHLLRGRLEPAGGRNTDPRVEAHVSRSVDPKREAPGCVVELEGRDAQVKKDAIESARRKFADPRKVDPDQG